MHFKIPLRCLSKQFDMVQARECSVTSKMRPRVLEKCSVVISILQIQNQYIDSRCVSILAIYLFRRPRSCFERRATSFQCEKVSRQKGIPASLGATLRICKRPKASKVEQCAEWHGKAPYDAAVMKAGAVRHLQTIQIPELQRYCPFGISSTKSGPFPKKLPHSGVRAPVDYRRKRIA